MAAEENPVRSQTLLKIKVGNPERGNMSKPIGWKNACGVVLLCAAATVYLPAQTYTPLFSFNRYNGGWPSAVVQGIDGNFYGTTNSGGSPKNDGTVFKLTPAGKLTTLHRFSGGVDGATPRAALVLGTDGNFYGTTNLGGPNNSGTVFKMKPGGRLTILHSFSGADGANPWAGLIRATDGNFYGTTSAGGARGDGTVFKITSGGTLTTLYSFAGADGYQPTAALVQASDGNFYGTTSGGGANGEGTVFKITSGGTLTTLYSFCAQAGCSDGRVPAAELALGSDGDFYGTTGLGANNDSGTVFKITPGGFLTTLHSFSSFADGGNPQAALMQASDGNFYGTTLFGGNTGHQGTVFKITPGGTLTTLHDGYGPTGYWPRAVLIQATDGNLYGAMASGGSNGAGVVFQLSVGLTPIAEELPASASSQ
jgi:uncharacterized repeat protein (TIGR03803 family)